MPAVYAHIMGANLASVGKIYDHLLSINEVHVSSLAFVTQHQHACHQFASINKLFRKFPSLHMRTENLKKESESSANWSRLVCARTAMLYHLIDSVHCCLPWLSANDEIVDGAIIVVTVGSSDRRADVPLERGVSGVPEISPPATDSVSINPDASTSRSCWAHTG